MAHVYVSGLTVLDLIFSIDHLPGADEKMRARKAVMIGGGGGANAAVAIARLGGRATLGTRLGNDATGDLILDDLCAEGVICDQIHRAKGGCSGFSSIHVTPDGKRQIVGFRGDGLAEDPAFMQLPAGVDAVLADSRWSEGARHVLALGRSRAIPAIVDAEPPFDPALFAVASHVAFGRQALVELTGSGDLEDALRAVSEHTDAWLCVTDGENGVICLEDGALRHVPAFPVQAVDTLAAGDVWHGAFALRIAEGADEMEAVAFANAAAALKCMRFGGRMASPDRAAVERLLAKGVQSEVRPQGEDGK